MKKIIHSQKLAPSVTAKPTMQTKSIADRPAYYIRWRDAFTETDEWHSSSSMTDEDYVCETIGFLIEDNNSKKNYISIAGTVTVEGMYASIINIPKAMIITKKLVKFT